MERIGQLVARGTRSCVYAWGRGAVVKVPDRSTPDDWIHFEALYTAAVRDAGAPAPRLLGIERFDGRVASVYERIHGPSMWQYLIDRPDRAAHHGRVLADLQVTLSALVPPVSLPGQIDRLSAKIRQVASVDASFADALAMIPCASGTPRVCHGDLHPGNVILSPDGPVVIDWFDASRGEPAADVARTLLLLLPEADRLPSHLPGADLGLLAAFTAAYATAVADRLALSEAIIRRWQAVEAVARLAEGVASLALRDLWQAQVAGS